MSEQIPWPEKPADSAFWVAKHAYERARADAAIARLRLAVKALGEVSKVLDDDVFYCGVVGLQPYKQDYATFVKVRDALSKIGPIPE
jgi:hypothetical protein